MSAAAELLLHVLTVCVRMLTRNQTMRLLGIADRANVKRLVRGLAARGLVSEITVWAKPVPETKGPLYASTTTVFHAALTATEPPELNRILRLAHARWAGVSAVPMACILATGKTGQIYGVPRTGVPAKPIQCSHDIMVSEVLVFSILEGLIQAEDWHGEDFGDCRCGDKYADAVLTTGGKQGRKIIEIVGANYTHDKLFAISSECNRRGVPYEFW
jgi:hypothetical protein